jgi:uncharacterized protein (TIGR02266 family)
MGAGVRAHSSELTLPQAGALNRAPSFPAELRIRLACRSASEFLDRHAADVSRGGIFVRHVEVLPVGRAVRLNLQLADGSALLVGEGTVFWTREADATRSESDPGMGIRFTRLTADSQRMLTHLLTEKAERERHDDGSSDFDEDERTVVATAEELRAAAESGHDPSVDPVMSAPALAVMRLDADLAPPPPSAPLTSARIVALRSPTPSAAYAPKPLVTLASHAPLQPLAPVMSTPANRAPSYSPAYAAPILPVPREAHVAAWEIEDAPIDHQPIRSMSMLSAFPSDTAQEPTDLAPRTRRNIGLGVAIGVIAALAACFLLLRTPAARPLPAKPATPVATGVVVSPPEVGVGVAAPTPPPALPTAAAKAPVASAIDPALAAASAARPIAPSHIAP